MIRLAKSLADEYGVTPVCEFRTGNFFEFQSREKFDIALAIGVFDYVENAIPLLQKIRSLARTKIITSFPSYSVIRTPIRKFRYKLKRCPVYFYTREKIENLARQMGFDNFEIIKIKGAGMDFFLRVDL